MEEREREREREREKRRPFFGLEIGMEDNK